MVRSRKRTTEKAAWTEEKLAEAISAVKEGRKLREVSRSYKIPLTTLHDRIKSGDVKPPQMGRKSVFTPIQEKEMADHILLLAKVFHGITPMELRKLAYEYAERNDVKNNFNKSSRLAGSDWLCGFLKRNPQISVRKPEATSLNRVMGFNEQEVKHFFENLDEVTKKNNFQPSRIFNVDETGITNVHKPSSILAPKGQKQVGGATSGERGRTVSVCCAFNAVGSYVPPMFIFPRERMGPAFERGGPAGSLYRCSKNGWMTDHLFQDWLKHFADFCTASKETPVLLILDNHCSHTSLATYNFCRDNGIVLVSLPPHTSHKLQPLDVTFYGPLKAEYRRQCDHFMKSKGRLIQSDLPSIFKDAFAKVANIQKAISGFEKTGIHPLNPDIFTENDFVAARHLMPTLPDDSVNDNKMPETQSENNLKDKGEGSISGDSTPSTSFAEISPVPGPSHLREQQKKRTTKKGTSQILTSTPLKDVLEKREERKLGRQLKKKDKVEKKSARPSPLEERSKKKRKYCKRSLKFESSDEEDVNDENLCDDSDDDIHPIEAVCQSNKEEVCSVCGEFGKDRELWYKCVRCQNWSHAECSGWDSSGQAYRCDYCRL